MIWPAILVFVVVVALILVVHKLAELGLRDFPPETQKPQVTDKSQNALQGKKQAVLTNKPSRVSIITSNGHPAVIWVNPHTRTIGAPKAVKTEPPGDAS